MNINKSKFKFALIDARIEWCKKHLEEAIINDDLDKLQEYQEHLAAVNELYTERIKKFEELISLKKRLKSTEKIYYLQETIGNYKQVPAFSGTYEECQKKYEEVLNSGSFAIVSEDELEIDYI